MTDSSTLKRIANKLMGGSKSRSQQVKSMRSGFKQANMLNAKRSKLNQSSARLPERKYLDILGNQVISTIGSPTLLNGIAEGSDNTQRIGRKITMRSLQLKGQVALSQVDLGVVGTYPENADTIRIAIVFDKQANGVAPAVGDVWNVSGGAAFAPYSARNMDNVDRFDVLMQDQVTLNLSGPGAAIVDRYLKINLPVRYTGTAGAIANITTGSLYLFALDTNGTGLNQGTFQFTHRVLYTDD